MILHRISVHQPPRIAPSQLQRSKGKYRGEHGSDDHRKFIFQRTLTNCKFEKGDWVLYKRNPYQVVYICEDVDEVEWDGLSAKIVTIFDGGEYLVSVHPNQLKRKK